ncbi:hypothetical protein PV772_03535 [Pseudarthrobacter sp. CC12]|uniref:hypothetical protein n=1 Tax=Pseudarthrobacter sp. CC12 TaxID=3029193 RepID=UPI0032678AF3
MTTTEPSPRAIIAEAEQEEREAAALVATLEEKVRDGDEAVTFEEVEKARGLLSFVRLRQEAARRKAAKAQEAARLAACEALYEDVSAHVKGDGQRFSEQLRTAVEALRAFHNAVEERNEKIRGYRQRAEALGIPVHKHTGPASTAAHGGVRLATGGGPGLAGGVVVGRSRVDMVDADTFANRALDLLVREGKLKLLSFVDAGADLFGDLAAIDAEAPESSAKYFYRNRETGGIFRKDEPFTDEQIKSGNLTAITKAEADAE